MEEDDGEEEDEDVDTINLAVPELEMSGVTASTHTLSHLSGKVCYFFPYFCVTVNWRSLSVFKNISRRIKPCVAKSDERGMNEIKNANKFEVNLSSNLQTQEEEIEKVSLYNVLKKNSPEWKYILLGCFGAGLFGTYPPLFGYSLGGFFDVSMCIGECTAA